MRRVVKLGGRAQGDPAVAALVARVVSSGDALCVVHGGGDEVSEFQRRLGLHPTFVGGRRVTSEEDLAIVRMVLSGATNKRLVARFVSVGVRAVGISGEDGGMFDARVTDARLGRVGGTLTVDPTLIETLLAGGFVPVISPLARDAADPDGGGLNVNGDDAASALAAAIAADDLVLVADVPGVQQGNAVMACLDLDGARALIDGGIATGGMAAKLDAAAAALRAGVANVRIAGIAGIADIQAGTRITNVSSTVR